MDGAGEQCHLTSRWETLPEHVLVSVFSCLTSGQRLQAALTCKSWSTCLENPRLWHRFVCKFLAPDHGKVLAPIEQMGHHVRALVMEVDQEDCGNRQNACKVLNSLANNPARKLSSLKVQFVGQNPLFYTGQEFMTELKLLFSPVGDSPAPFSQLTHIDLSGLDFAFNDSLLDTLSEHHPGLEFLDVQNNSIICKISPNGLHRLVSRCTKLKDLRVFHLSFTEAVLTEIAEQAEPCLEHLSIVYRRDTKYTEDLSSDAWSKLVTKLPKLRVTLSFDHTCPFDRICKMMKPQIPVTDLRLETFTRTSQEVNHATNCYHRTLEKLVLQTQNSEALGQALVRLVANCERLNSLSVYCVLSKDVIQQILELRPEIKQEGSYMLKSMTEEDGPWVIGAKTIKEAEEKLASDGS